MEPLNLHEKLGSVAHRVKHWEYWPAAVIYLPTILLWLCYAVRFRTLKFYSLANPLMNNGGLFNDPKSAVYNRLAKGFYPATIRITYSNISHLPHMLEQRGLHYPLIAKPDIGQRGKGVQYVKSYADVERYLSKMKKPFLIQEIIEYPNEIGLFYCRIPGEQKGRITGITEKKFLKVTGDGNSSIGNLLKKEARGAMQIGKLKTKIDLSEILARGEERVLVPFGNHNRGTQFISRPDKITPALENQIDIVLSPLQGFFYGRLDIRFRSFEALENGENFSIIEINGAKSEPTHIYDPSTTFFQGQKEIFRHQRLFYKVIQASKRLKFKPALV